MSVRISLIDDNRVSIELDKEDLNTILSYLAHAKFVDEIKVYVLLSPLMNELIREIIAFSDRHNIRESGSAWERSITKEEASNPLGFVFKVMSELSREFGEEEAKRFLGDAIYPNRLEPPATG